MGLGARRRTDPPREQSANVPAAACVILHKIDLLPYLDFDRQRALASLRAINSDADVLSVSAQTGEGLTEWDDWLRRRLAAVRETAFA